MYVFVYGTLKRNEPNHDKMLRPKRGSNSFIGKAQCLKIIQKVAFNIASEASYVYILSGQKFIKNAKNSPFWRKIKMRHFW